LKKEGKKAMSKDSLRNRHPIECMENALETFRERNKVYGDNYHQHGKVMMALFPNGVHLATEKEWNRFGIVNMLVAKMTRYCQGWPRSHQDSIHDMGVYAFMLESLDSED
jgi:hypothetical protein